MFNWLHSLLHDPAKGWDPISKEHAERYSVEAKADATLVASFASAVDGLDGKKIADVGSGPGEYALEFARLGALVTCVDVSQTYLDIACARLEQEGLRCKRALGYIDHIDQITAGAFDGIFSNVSWNYSMNDFSFARRLVHATRPGGTVFVRETNEMYECERSLRRDAIYWINKHWGWKIGHPHPPRGRIAKAFMALGCCEVTTDYSDPLVDIVLARPGGGARARSRSVVN